MTRRTLLALLLAGGLLLTLLLAVLVVTRGDIVEDDGEPTTLLVSGQADVPRGQVHDDVFLLRGTAVVRGTVEDDVIVVDGRARIEGIVHGDVMVLSGRAVVTGGAEIDGDVRTSEPARISPRATVRGEVGDAGLLDALGAIPRLVWFGLWLAAGLSVLALLALGPRRAAEVATEGVGRPSRAFALGAVVLAATPFAIALLALSLVGSLVALVLAAGLVVATALGAAVSGAAVGRFLPLRRSALRPYAGWAVIGAGLALALLVSPVLALLLAAAVVAFGVGALVPARQAAGAAPMDGDHDPESDEIDWDSLLEDGAAPTDAHESEPRILAAFPLSNGYSRD